MNNELVKDVFKLHFDLMDALSDYIPPRIKTDLLVVQKDFLEIAKEHTDNQENKESVQNIPIN